MMKIDRENRPTLSRRELLQGKLWKLLRPQNLRALVVRYPRCRDDLDTSATPAKTNPPAPSLRTIAGIVVEPVAPTPGLSRPSERYFPVFRPPGAVAEQLFMAECTRCGDCIRACPYNAIRQAPERLGAVAGTPVIEADLAACMMCADFPCIASCQPGVLVASLPKVMGTAQVTAQLCLAHQGTTCTVCVERCPVAGAVELVAGQPLIDENRCTGCGVCRYVCPAPENAVLLMPILHRPPFPDR
jgi:MauM/NapG family ferredoxin protein